jgi:hypothetical protein
MKASFLFNTLFVVLLSAGSLMSQQAATRPLDDTGLLLVNNWQMMSMTYEDGAVIKAQKEGERDLLVFNANNTVSITKMGKVANGSWKFSPTSWELYILEKGTGASIQYKVKELTADKLVLFYYDEVNKSKLLNFAPVQ